MPAEAERLLVVPEINPRLVAQETQTESFQPPVGRLRLLGQALVEVAVEVETASTNGFNPRPVDYRIVSQFDQSPAQSFNRQVVVETVVADYQESLKPSYIKHRLTTLVRHGYIKRIAAGEYASLDHPAPAWQPPKPLIADRISQLVTSQPDREWGAAAIMAALNADPNAPDLSLELHQIQKGLTYLNRRGDRVRAVSRGRYVSVDYDGPVRQQPRKTAQRLFNLFEQNSDQAFDLAAASRLLASDGHWQVKETTVENNLKLLRQQGLIKRVIDQHHHASLNCPLPEYRPPLSVIDRLCRLLQDNDQDFTKQTASQALATDGYPSVGLGYVRGRLRKMELAGLAVQTKPGRYARPNYVPSVRNPSITIQIATTLRAESNRDWSAQELVEVIQHPDPDKTIGVASISSPLIRLTKARKIKQISRGRYAGPNYVPSVHNPSITIRITTTLRAESNRDWSAQELVEVIQHPDKTTEVASIGRQLSRLTKARKIKRTSRGRYASLGYVRPRPKKTKLVDQPDFYKIPSAPKNPPRVSLGRRIGRATRDLSYSLTPDELIDWVEVDGHGPVGDHQAAYQLAESVLKRKGKLASQEEGQPQS